MTDDERKALIEKYLQKAREGVEQHIEEKWRHYSWRVLELDIDQPEAWEYVSYRHGLRSEHDKALQLVERALQQHPDKAGYLVMKACILDTLANPLIGRNSSIPDPELHQQAMALLDQVLQMDPNNIEAIEAKIFSLRNEETPELPRLLERLISAVPDDPEVLLDLTERVYKPNNFVKRCLDRIVDLYPMDGKVWLELARKYYDLELVNETGDCLKNATLADPDDVHIRLEAAAMYRELGQVEDQLSCVIQAQALAGNDKQAWTAIYYQLRQLGEREAAEKIPREKLSFRIEANLKDFIQTGQISPIHLGMTRQEVYSILGEPDGWFGDYYSLTEDKFTPIGPRGYPFWVYAPFDFYFGEVEQRLYRIYTDHLEWIGKRGEAIKLDGWLFEEDPSDINRVRAALREMGIAFEEVDKNGLFGELLLENGIVIGYEYDEEHRDQISVLHITDETYDDYQQ